MKEITSKHICTLKEQDACDLYGSLDCLSGNSDGIKALRQVCFNGKKGLEKLPEDEKE
ncbi:MAG: hypothetical protein [Asgard archaea virus VerdaV3]|nr:MAG: hypothetical protein [Asgard archaea virus VerdaV3]